MLETKISGRRMSRAVALVLLAISASSFADTAPQTPRPDALQVVTQEKAYMLYVPVSRLVMFIPRGNLAHTPNPYGGAADSPRYFYFTDRAFNVSGWFEPAESFHGMRKFWDEETRAWKSGGLPSPENVAFKKIEGWDAVLYDTPSSAGNNSHIRAHWVQAGTWIDIHVSMTSSRSSTDIRSVLETFLKAVLVKERSQ